MTYRPVTELTQCCTAVDDLLAYAAGATLAFGRRQKPRKAIRVILTVIA